jgi:hypothetical protein
MQVSETIIAFSLAATSLLGTKYSLWLPTVPVASFTAIEHRHGNVG